MGLDRGQEEGEINEQGSATTGTEGLRNTAQGALRDAWNSSGGRSRRGGGLSLCADDGDSDSEQDELYCAEHFKLQKTIFDTRAAETCKVVRCCNEEKRADREENVVRRAGVFI